MLAHCIGVFLFCWSLVWELLCCVGDVWVCRVSLIGCCCVFGVALVCCCGVVGVHVACMMVLLLRVDLSLPRRCVALLWLALFTMLLCYVGMFVLFVLDCCVYVVDFCCCGVVLLLLSCVVVIVLMCCWCCIGVLWCWCCGVSFVLV